MQQASHQQREPSELSARNLAAALGYARLGWPVYPVHAHINGYCLCRQAGCTHAGYHPLRSPRRATTNPKVIRAWWGQHPEAGIGVRLPKGYVVVDPDTEEGLAFIRGHHLPLTWIANTGGGGMHIWFRLPEGVTLRGPHTGVRPGLDLLGEGSCIIMPPSEHASRNFYEWADACSMDDIREPVMATDWALELVAEVNALPAPVDGGIALERLRRDVEIRRADVDPDGVIGYIGPHTRNTTIFRHGCWLRHLGADAETILRALLAANRRACYEPLGQAEVKKTARSILRYPQGDIRLHNWLLEAPISVGAKVAGALVAMTGGKATNAEMAEIVDVTLGTLESWRAQLVAADLEDRCLEVPDRCYTLVPPAVLTTRGLSAGARVTAMVIAQLGNGGELQVNQQRLAERRRVCDRTIRNHATALQAGGLLEVERSSYVAQWGRRQWCNLYRLVAPADAERGAEGTQGAAEDGRGEISDTTKTTRAASPSLFMEGQRRHAVGGGNRGEGAESAQVAAEDRPDDPDLGEIVAADPVQDVGAADRWPAASVEAELRRLGRVYGLPVDVGRAMVERHGIAAVRQLYEPAAEAEVA